ncbi:MAG: ABC transporter substrate-binding protein [Faecousia sp.]
MKKNLSKILALVLVVAMMATLFVGCGSSKQPKADPDRAKDYTGGDTLVVGYNPFSQKFSPFFATTAYDTDVASMTQVALLGSDREGNVVLKGIEGETIPYNGTDHTYYGIADCEVTQNDDGTVVYDFKLRDDITFSDGEKLTADDVIFNMYVLSDPTYDGASSFYAQPIVGMEEYRAGMESLTNLILAAGPDAVSEYSNADQTAAFWTAFDAAGETFAQEIVDYCVNGYGAADVTEAAAMWGYELEEGATAADFFKTIAETYAYDISDNGINYESAGSTFGDLLNAELGDHAAEYAKGIQTGESAANISGIEKTGDYSLKVTMSSFDAVAIYNVGVTVAPMHYYGDASLYNYDNNQFGFTKGDLSTVRAKTTQPMGAGPYKFVSYENGVVTFERNETYYCGCPYITNILFQETSSGDMLTGVASGTFDLADPNFTTDTVESIKEYNGGELSGSVLTTVNVDNLGYGYIGINADTVNVGGDPGSDASKNLRKAFATLFSVYRDTAINSYYGERASIINYPISNTSWAAPKPADEGYEVAYSTDVDGKPIYTDGMSDTEKYDAALQAAVGFLKAAGYTYDEASGKFTAAPDGAEMSYEIIIPADGSGDHPSYSILTDAKKALESIGITLEINDPADSNVLWDSLDAGTQNMWAAAWGATADPDMYQVYHSSNIVGKGGTDSNHYHIADANLDQMIMDARTSADQSYRKSTYKKCLETILDWAVEVPVYQRQNAFVFSTERIKIDTLTPDITTFWGWMNDLENLQMN